MFSEIDSSLLKQTENALKKRWFRDSPAECDLFIWEDSTGTIDRFQFWYKDALIKWDQQNGIRTGRVDEKSGAFVNYQTDIYRLHSDIDDDLLVTVQNMLFDGQSGENKVLDFIKDLLHNIADEKS